MATSIEDLLFRPGSQAVACATATGPPASRSARRARPAGTVVAEAHAKRPAPVCPQGREVAARLRALEDAEAVRLARDLDIVGVVPQDLQEQTAVGAALVELPRGVQVPRAVADGGGEVEAVAQPQAHRLELLPDGRARGQVGLKGDVVAGRTCARKARRAAGSSASPTGKEVRPKPAGSSSLSSPAAT